MDKPTDVKTAGALLLAGGIWSCIMALTVMLASFFLCFPCYIYGFAAGVYAIVKGTELLNNDCYGAGVPRLAAMLQIGQIIDFDVIGMGMGIGALILLDDKKVKAYLEGTAPLEASAHVAHAQVDAGAAAAPPDPAVVAVAAVRAEREAAAAPASVEADAIAQAAWETPGWGGGGAPSTPSVPPAWGGDAPSPPASSAQAPQAPPKPAFSVEPVATAAPVVVESMNTGALPSGGQGSPWGGGSSAPASSAPEQGGDAGGAWSDWNSGAQGGPSDEAGTGYKVAPWGQSKWAEFDASGERVAEEAEPAEVGVPANSGRKHDRR